MSKATALGYLVHLHVVLIPEDTSVERVRFRVQRGGHPVPEEKIRQRYARLWTLVADASLIADRTMIYDNTNATDTFRVIATYERGLLLGDADWPSWTPPELQ